MSARTIGGYSARTSENDDRFHSWRTLAARIKEATRPREHGKLAEPIGAVGVPAFIFGIW
jgi:hypothetical protein